MFIPQADPTPIAPVPSAAQLRWQRSEFGIFVHYGINTYTGREWGDGTEDPKLFNPTRLDTDQWAAAAKAAGAAHMVLTCKHHDGFCMWPSAHTDHSVKSSPWEGGKGDVVRRFVDSCNKYGLGYGFYLSPWDRHEPRYGNSDAYNAYYQAQLKELLTGYGTGVHELWFDGAIDSESRKRGQKYDFDTIFALCKQYQPQAVTFGDGGTDVRWIGNERGFAADPCWAPVRPDVIRYPGDSGIDTGMDARAKGLDIARQLQHGDTDGTVWRPGEADVSIRPGWFYHPYEDEQVRSVDNLIDLYFHSVGRNAFMLLNVPPTPEGVFHDVDVARLRDFRQRLDTLFAHDLAEGSQVTLRDQEIELTLPGPTRFDTISLREKIELGQRVRTYWFLYRDVAGQWHWAVEGHTIGNRKLDRLSAPVVATAVKVMIKWTKVPTRISEIALYDSQAGT
ncbi:MAG: alpha-L-fucosidase [Phycisphaerae bacterium]